MKRVRGFEVVSKQYRQHPDTEIKLPTRGSQFSAGYDFYLPCNVTVQPKSSVLIWTDVKAYMQPDEVLQIYVRSSVGINKHLMLSNTVPIIDSDYYDNVKTGGNIGISIYNYGDKPVTLLEDERIAQGIFQRYLVADNGNTDVKRVGGIGSSDK